MTLASRTLLSSAILNKGRRLFSTPAPFACLAALGMVLLAALLGRFSVEAPAGFTVTAYAQQRGESPLNESIEVSVAEMAVTQAGVSLTLSDMDSPQSIHLMIGPAEGQAIVRALRHVKTPRPMTHDLMKIMLERDGWRVERVLIRDLIDNTFYADIVLEKNGQQQVIDARPSDAMAIGLRFDAKIFVRQKVFTLEREHMQQERPPKVEDKPDTLTI